LTLGNNKVANEIIFDDTFIKNKFLIQNFRAKAEVKNKDNNQTNKDQIDENDSQVYYAFYSLPII
jgi:hypothetical protein